MKIAVIGAIDSPIRKDSLGGTEMWTYNLVQGLISRGHEVDLIASSGSESAGKVIECCKPEEIREESGSILKANYFALSVEQALMALDIENNYDLIHLSVFDYFCYLPVINRLSKPSVVTLHGYNRIWGGKANVLLERFQNPCYTFVSPSFLKNWPEPKKSALIRNGVDYSKFQFSDKHGQYLFWIGRISEEKGVADAIEIAEQSGEKLIIAGPIGDKVFFESSISPKLDDNIKYAGELSFESKKSYFSNAKALLFPIRLPEPMPLVVLESLASGTPVISYNIDPMNDVLANGQNGFVVEPANIQQAAEAVRKIETIDRNNCLQTIKGEYSFGGMLDNYEKLYNSLI